MSTYTDNGRRSRSKEALLSYDPTQGTIQVTQWIEETEKLFGQSFDQLHYLDALDMRHLAILLCRVVSELSEIRGELAQLRSNQVG